MGGCCSDPRGGMEGVGGGAQGSIAGHPATATAGHTSQTEANAAVDHFFNSRGLRGLYIPLERGFDYSVHALYEAKTALKLSLSASKLQDMDVFSKSDPMAVLYVKKQDGKLEEVGRTEVIQNSLNPAWITKICINFQFEMVQNLVFRIFDIDTKFHNTPIKSLQLNDQDYLGEASCVLSEIVTKQDRSVTLKLQKRPGMAHFGSLMVHAEETVASKQAVELILRCTHLENKDTFSKSDPFIRISRTVEGGALVPICKTEVINNNLNPVWRPVTLTTQQFYSKENPLVIECFDFESSGKHVLLGRIDVSIAELQRLNRERVGTNFYVNHHGQRKVLKGQLFVDKFDEKTQYSFLDYISGGFELNFMVAIDFTASNGDPRMPQSLHYIDPAGRLNSYQQAIIGVGEVLQFYDTDKRFPAWGFGGRTRDGVSHCFNLNLLPMEAEVVGLEGIMGAYSTALHSVSLAGPTLFGPVINRAAEIAAQSLSYSQNKYFVLLIITDGVINDPNETKDAIVRASDLPLSILIVGVGNADFKQMEILDADGSRRLESSTGRVATRDIVQFVPMRDFLGGQVSIVQALLEELPGQFLSYVRSRDIKPRFAQELS